MQYGEVVQTINSLIPEMVRSGDPERVLIKYARDHGLAPAVLERMGNAFNLGTALQAQMGPDRGVTVPLLDLPSMVSKYATWQAPAAVPEIREPVTKRASVPDLMWGLTHKRLETADPDTVMAKAASEDIGALVNEYGAAEQVLSDTGYALCKRANEFMRELTSKGYTVIDMNHNEFDVHEVESDVIRRSGDMAKRAFDWFELHAGQRWAATCKRASAQDIARHTLAHNWSGCGDAADALVAAFKASTDAGERASAILKTAADKGLSRSMLEKAAVSQTSRQRQADDIAENAMEVTPSRQGAGQATDFDFPQGESTADTATGDAQAGSTAIGGTPRPGRAPLNVFFDRPAAAREKAPDVDYHIDETVSKILGLLGRPTAIAQKGVVNWLTQPREREAQRKVDLGARNVLHGHVLQSLMLTDPVISKADPEQVAEIYETIRRGSEDVASDKNLLRFQLREALQYGGVPPDGYKQLQEIGKLRDTHDKAERDENRYGPARALASK